MTEMPKVLVVLARVAAAAVLAGCIDDQGPATDGEEARDGSAADATRSADAVRSTDASAAADARPDEDMRTPLLDGGVVDRAPCVVTFTTRDGCTREAQIPRWTVLGCEAFATAACEAFAECSGQPAPTHEECAWSLLVPRGAITLADYCPYAGMGPMKSLADLGRDLMPGLFETPPGAMSGVAMSDSCALVPAWTLWGEDRGLFMSLLDADAQLPPVWPAGLDEVAPGPMLVSLEYISAAYPSAPGTLRWLGSGVVDGALSGYALGGPMPAYVVHTQTHALFAGVLGDEGDRLGDGSWVVARTSLDESGLDFEGFDQLDPWSRQFAIGRLVGAGLLRGPDAPCLSDCGCGPTARCGDEGYCAMTNEPARCP